MRPWGGSGSFLDRTGWSRPYRVEGEMVALLVFFAVTVVAAELLARRTVRREREGRS